MAHHLICPLGYCETMKISICWLLNAAWIAGILPILIVSLPFQKLNKVHAFILGFAKRGKLMPSPSSKFTVPQRFFLHFYVVAVVWTTFLLGTTWIYAHRIAPLVSESELHSIIASHLTGGSHIFAPRKEEKYMVWRSVFLLLLIELQVVRRLIESIYVFNYSPSARMHIFGYLTGLFFYTAAPLSLCCNCAPEVLEFIKLQVAEFIVRGKAQMGPLEINFLEYAEPFLKLGWCQWIGAAVLLWGWVHQRRCHAILGSLREKKEQNDEYVIPHGDWFKNVSSPHYLAEIVIYAGLLIASGGKELTIWLLFGFVVANLVIAAAETHRWYLRKFDDYPSNRFAIIPFIF